MGLVALWLTMNYIAKYYTPTGMIQMPVQTLHSDRDPVVPAWHEGFYAKFALDQGTIALLEQQIVPAFGHCAFTDAQMLASFDRLVERVTGAQ